MITKSLVFFALFAALLATSCKKDDDSTPASTSTPTNTDPRAVHVGTYLVTDSLWIGNQSTSPVTYVLSITTGGTASDTLHFNNLFNDGASYYALYTNNFFSFPSQNVSGPYNLTGSGTFAGTAVHYQTSGDAFVHHGHGEKQ